MIKFKEDLEGKLFLYFDGDEKSFRDGLNDIITFLEDLELRVCKLEKHIHHHQPFDSTSLPIYPKEEEV